MPSLSNTVVYYTLEAITLVSCTHILNRVYVRYNVLRLIYSLIGQHKLTKYLRECRSQGGIGYWSLSFSSLVRHICRPQYRGFPRIVATVRTWGKRYIRSTWANKSERDVFYVNLECSQAATTSVYINYCYGSQNVFYTNARLQTTQAQSQPYEMIFICCSKLGGVPRRVSSNDGKVLLPNVARRSILQCAPHDNSGLLHLDRARDGSRGCGSGLLSLFSHLWLLRYWLHRWF